jgi:hypothetical protein
MSERQSNRESMPTIAQIVDEIRAQGIDVRVLWASEGGKTVGRKPQQENAYPLEQNRFRNLTRRTK